MDGSERKKAESQSEIIISAIVQQKPSCELINICKEIEKNQRRDTSTHAIIDKLENKDERINKRYEMINNVLYKKAKDRSKIPLSVLKSFVNGVYEAYGHIGGLKLNKIISEHFSPVELD